MHRDTILSRRRLYMINRIKGHFFHLALSSFNKAAVNACASTCSSIGIRRDITSQVEGLFASGALPTTTTEALDEHKATRHLLSVVAAQLLSLQFTAAVEVALPTTRLAALRQRGMRTAQGVHTLSD